MAIVINSLQLKVPHIQAVNNKSNVHNRELFL